MNLQNILDIQDKSFGIGHEVDALADKISAVVAEQRLSSGIVAFPALVSMGSHFPMIHLIFSNKLLIFSGATTFGPQFQTWR
jgi:hypothetical protein